MTTKEWERGYVAGWMAARGKKYPAEIAFDEDEGMVPVSAQRSAAANQEITEAEIAQRYG